MTVTHATDLHPAARTIPARPTSPTRDLLDQLIHAAADLATSYPDVEAWARAEALVDAVAPITGVPVSDLPPFDPSIVSMRTLAAAIRRLRQTPEAPTDVLVESRERIARSLASR